MLTAGNSAYRDPAVRCLTQISEQTQDADLKRQASELLASTSGDEAELARILASIPAERRLEVVLKAVHALGEGECLRKVSLLQLLPRSGGGEGSRLVVKLGALRDCQTYGPARDLYLEALAQARAEDLVSVIWAWFGTMNGSYSDNHGMGVKVVAILEERLKHQDDNLWIWRALALAYQMTGLDDRRAVHLVAWLNSSLWSPPDRDQIFWLGAFYAGQDDPQAGIVALRQRWQRSRRIEIASTLANLLLTAGKTDDFAALTAELAATKPVGEGKEAPETSLARLLRARSTLVRQGPEAALPEYEAWFDRGGYLEPSESETDEYLSIVVRVRSEDTAAKAARTVCSGRFLPSGSTPSECAANLLARIGASAGALRLLEGAVQRAPGDLRLQMCLARVAEQAGDLDRAEAAYRRVSASDPRSEAAGASLARITEQRERP